MYKDKEQRKEIKMSILSTKAKTLDQMPLDEIYVIYGETGTGKTVLASTFPQTKDAPLLYLDFLEGGTGSISLSHKDTIQVVQISKYEELDEVLTDLEQGYTTDQNGNKIDLKYSTIVFDSASQLEYMLKQYVMNSANKDKMNLGLWGDVKNGHEQLWNMCKYLHQKTGARIVVISLPKEVQDEDNPEFNKTVPNLMSSASASLCAKASFVWFTKIEKETSVDPKTQQVVESQNYYTYIDRHPYLLTKCRKPVEVVIPQKVKNLTYDKFKKNILDKLK
jgi:hypothetical protein